MSEYICTVAVRPVGFLFPELPTPRGDNKKVLGNVTKLFQRLRPSLVAQCKEGCSCSLLVSTCLMGVLTGARAGLAYRWCCEQRTASFRRPLLPQWSYAGEYILETGQDAAHWSLRTKHTTSYTEARSVKPRRDRKSVQSGAKIQLPFGWMQADGESKDDSVMLRGSAPRTPTSKAPSKASQRLT
jgi:hypothetical protein